MVNNTFYTTTNKLVVCVLGLGGAAMITAIALACIHKFTLAAAFGALGTILVFGVLAIYLAFRNAKKSPVPFDRLVVSQCIDNQQYAPVRPVYVMMKECWEKQRHLKEFDSWTLGNLAKALNTDSFLLIKLISMIHGTKEVQEMTYGEVDQFFDDLDRVISKGESPSQK